MQVFFRNLALLVMVAGPLHFNFYLDPAIAHSDFIFHVFDRDYFEQVLKVNFPSLAASKNYDLTLLIPFCMF